MRSSGRTSRLDAYFREKIAEGLSDCFDAAVIKDGELVYSFREGMSAPIDHGGEVIKPDDRFNVFSVTKPVTAALAVKLAEQRRISLEDPVMVYIPEYRFGKVTVKDLMIHTSGYDPQDRPKISWPVSNAEMDGYFSSILDLDIKYSPGERSDYTTYGYSLLMKIIEKAADKSFEGFASEELFTPLGMKHSTFEAGKCKGRYVLPWDDTEKCFLGRFAGTPPTGDIGLLTNARDTALFGSVFTTGRKNTDRKVFSETGRELMLTDQTGGRFNRTAGFWIKGSKDLFGCFGERCSERAVGHVGLSGCMLITDPLYNISIAVITNSLRLGRDWNNYKVICDYIMSMWC